MTLVAIRLITHPILHITASGMEPGSPSGASRASWPSTDPGLIAVMIAAKERELAGEIGPCPSVHRLVPSDTSSVKSTRAKKRRLFLEQDHDCVSVTCTEFEDHRVVGAKDRYGQSYLFKHGWTLMHDESGAFVVRGPQTSDSTGSGDESMATFSGYTSSALVSVFGKFDTLSIDNKVPNPTNSELGLEGGSSLSGTDHSPMHVKVVDAVDPLINDPSRGKTERFLFYEKAMYQVIQTKKEQGQEALAAYIAARLAADQKRYYPDSPRIEISLQEAEDALAASIKRHRDCGVEEKASYVDTVMRQELMHAIGIGSFAPADDASTHFYCLCKLCKPHGFAEPKQ